MRFGRCGTVVAMLVLARYSAEAQTVQLPSFQQFSVQTVVTVPDRGSAQLGGVTRVGHRSSTFRVPPFSSARASSQSTTSSSASVHVEIIDLQEQDEAVMAEWHRIRVQQPSVDLATNGAASLAGSTIADSRPLGQSTNMPLDGNPQSLRQELQTRAMKAHAQAAEDYLAGLRLERQGKPRVAKIYYDMAWRHGSSETRALAQDRLQRMSPPSIVAK